MGPGQERHSTIGGGLFVSCLISFCWVGYYRYNYNISFFNSPIINWFAFLLWSTGLFITIRTYEWFKSVFRPFWVRIPVLWISYFMTLLFIEYLGYHIFKIREMTTEKPLCFGLIHGTPILKLYYLSAGIIAISLARVFRAVPLFLSGRRQNKLIFRV
jgi:hypothetical protein